MEPVIVAMIVLSATTGLVLGWALARFVRVALGVALVVLLALVIAALVLAERGAQGWDGLTYVVLALFIALPAALGAALGTAVGGWMRRLAGPR